MIYVRYRKHLTEGGEKMTEDKIKALQDLLKLLAENPDLAERITITIKPAKLQGKSKPESD